MFLFYSNDIEVAVVYYRSGYTDSDYQIDMEKVYINILNLIIPYTCFLHFESVIVCSYGESL